tara:strand:- start:267 stop:410 length:144 start_codon:yes stop_codon:yes gene_type:complete
MIDATPERLATSEIEHLRQQKRAISAYAQRVFSLRLRQRQLNQEDNS